MLIDNEEISFFELDIFDFFMKTYLSILKFLVNSFFIIHTRFKGYISLVLVLYYSLILSLALSLLTDLLVGDHGEHLPLLLDVVPGPPQRHRRPAQTKLYRRGR